MSTRRSVIAGLSASLLGGVWLARDWNTSLAYRFTQTDDEGKLAYSNAVTLNLSYRTYLFP